MTVQISVIIPVYNEIESLKYLHNQICTMLEKRFQNYEIIYIDDGSTDGSDVMINDLAHKNNFVIPIHFVKNAGKSSALAAGFKKCKGDLVLMLDADMQTSAEDIDLLMPHIAQYDMISGKRASREDGWQRKYASKIANFIRNIITGDNILDTGCPLKLFKNKVVKKYTLFDGMHRFLPTLAKWNGFTVLEVTVSHFDRQYGVSKYRNWHRGIEALFDAFAVRWMKSRILSYSIKNSKTDI